jgi:DNA-binding MarR family transcriptional regulator
MQEQKPPSSEQGETQAPYPPDTITIAHTLDELHTLLGRQFGPLSRPQRRMLLLLDEKKTIRVGEIADILGLTTAGTTRMLDKLESLGYAHRTRDTQNDQRQVYVTLTSSGRQALVAADSVFLDRVQTILLALDEGERTDLARLMRTISEHAR